MRVPHLVIVGLMVLLSACTTEIKATSTQNPPPSEPFKNFGQFKLHPVAQNPADEKDDANQRATQKIDEELQSTLGAQLLRWDKGEGRTLEIEPRVEEIKFVSGGKRFWAGWLAGSSAVVMQVNFKDADTGTTIAAPTFYQHASAMSGAFSIGGADNAMLYRIAEIINDYVVRNYENAVGGPTGAPPDRVSKQ
jgi:hypothetical protein